MNALSPSLKNILVRSPNWIGDQVMAFPFFYYLRKGFPKARIVSACPSWVESVQFRGLVDDVIVLPRVRSPGWQARIEAIEGGSRLLKQSGHWDLGIALPNSFTAAWQIFRAGAKVRRGYSIEGRGFLLNEKESWEVGNRLHRADAYVRLLPSEIRPRKSVVEFWGMAPENELDPKEPGELSSFDAEKYWKPEEVVLPPQGDYWVLAPGSTAESRRWPLEKFAALARRIFQETGWMGVIVGGVAEAAIAENLCSEDQHGQSVLLDFTARGSVSGLSRVFKEARFTVANDSGLAHVAALCGSPVEVIWGAGNPRRTRPLGPGQVQVALNAVDCWPCEQNRCDQPEEKRFECLKGITVESVWKQIEGQILRLEKRKEVFV